MKRKLGKSSIEVSALGLGCWAIGGPLWERGEAVGWGEVDDNESIKALECGIDIGINFIDTADLYGAGHSECVIGKVLKRKRDKVVLATKFGNTFDAAAKQITGENASPEYIRKACEASLERLKTDYIDLYQFHVNGYDIEKAVEVMDVLESLVDEGKIRYYGWSTNFSARADVFAKGKNCIAIQHEENVFNDNSDIIDICKKSNLASINRGPLAMGLLSGKYNENSLLGDKDIRGEKSPAWIKYFKNGKPSESFIKKLDSIRDILTSNGRSTAQGALAWIWARSDITIPIPGFRSAKQVMQNAEAMQFGPLTDSQMQQIETILMTGFK